MIPSEHVQRRPTQYTVQIDRDRHVEVKELSSMNHSCNPNVILDTTRMLAIATRVIVAGDELTFFYPSTEWQMAEPFECHCGAASCIGLVAGAASLPDDILSRYLVNQHIHALRRTG